MGRKSVITQLVVGDTYIIWLLTADQPFYTDQIQAMALALPVSVIQEARTVIDGNAECDLATTVHNFVRPMAPSSNLSSMAKIDEVQQVGWILMITILACVDTIEGKFLQLSYEIFSPQNTQTVSN